MGRPYGVCSGEEEEQRERTWAGKRNKDISSVAVIWTVLPLPLLLSLTPANASLILLIALPRPRVTNGATAENELI